MTRSLRKPSHRPPPRGMARLFAAAAALVLSAACVQILQVPDRDSADHLYCDEGLCACESGFGDCDHDLSNGCETSLSTNSSHCGECGEPCEGECVDGECEAPGPCMGAECECEADQAECDGNVDNGCESLNDHPQHCGACGCDCGGGECVDGECQVLLLSDDTYPDYMTLSEDYLYYLKYEEIMRVPKRGGASSVFATVGEDTEVYGLKYFDHRVYLLSQLIYGLSEESEPLADLGFIPNTNGGSKEFTIFGDHMYITIHQDPNPVLYKKSRLVDEAATELDDQSWLPVASDQNRVVWYRTNDPTDSLMSYDGETVATLKTITEAELLFFPRELAVQGNTLVAVDSISDEIYVLDLDTGDDRKIPEARATGVVVREGVIFFTSEIDSSVYRIDPGSLVPERIASGVPLTDGGGELLFDGEALYFPTVDGPARLAVCAPSAPGR